MGAGAPFLRITPPPVGPDGRAHATLADARRWALIVAVVAAFVGSLLYLQHQTPGPSVLTFDRADFIEAAGPAPPPDDAPGWQPTALADDWWRHRPHTTEGWYRVDLDLRVAPDRLWAIYLPSLSMNAAVLLNGELLGSGGRFEAPVARNWHRPLYFTVPNNLLAPGRNVIHVRVKAAPVGTGLLAKFHAGPDAMLRDSFRRRMLFRVTGPLVLAVASGVMGLAMLLVWALRREGAYGWFALGMLIFTARDLNLIVVESPLPGVFWDWLFIMGIAWVILLTTPWVNALLGLDRPWVDRAVLGWGLAHSVVLTWIAVTQPTILDWYWRHVWDPLLLPVGGLYPSIVMVRRIARSPDLTASCLTTAGLTVFALALHDLALLLGIVPRENGFIFHFGAAPVLVVFGGILLTRFVEGMREVEELNRGLEARVEEKTQEIERSYQRLAEFEARRVRGEERERILREVHDGVGAQIVASLAMLESGHADRETLETTLHDALDELRLTVDTLGSATGRDALTALAMLRQRLQPKLAAAGLRLVWRVADNVPLQKLGDEQTLDLLRIVQEALTNTLKHARARSVEVSIAAGPNGTGLSVAVADDGAGIRPGSPQGQGLVNMRRRAEQLGAALDVTSSGDGTTITVILPAVPGA